jgi:hypothetical protein
MIIISFANKQSYEYEKKENIPKWYNKKWYKNKG